MTRPDSGGAPGQVIARPLSFKHRLRIGSDAYRILRAKESLLPILAGAGGAGSGAGVAASGAVASTFFAPTGLTAWLGLASAVTPLGWILAAALFGGGVFFATGRWLGSTDGWLERIPTFINTPIDLLGDALMQLMGSLIVRVAQADGEFHPAERDMIMNVLANEWGYDSNYLQRALAEIEGAIGDERSLGQIAGELAAFQDANPDCNGEEMRRDLVELVREIVMADGELREAEVTAVAEIEQVLGLAPCIAEVLPREVRADGTGGSEEANIDGAS